MRWMDDNINQLIIAYYIKTFKFMSIAIVLSRLNEVKCSKRGYSETITVK